MKKITVLGVTGSIGTQTVDVVKNHPELFEITAMSGGFNVKKIEEIINEINVQYVVMMKQEDVDYLSHKYPDITFYCGEEGLKKIAVLDDVEIVLNAIVGFAGLIPTIEAIKHHKNIALANKETLVVAGEIITALCKEYNVQLLPVDSEHSAIWQSLAGHEKKDIDKILLTCSGGSFRDKTREELVGVTVEQALNHPNWSMGAKITIDSATLFNKGLEVIEAKWLFDVDYDQIEVVIHPESILHSAVQYKDHAVIGEMGCPDMRLPIQYALTYPERVSMDNCDYLDLTAIGTLHFYKPDVDRFRALPMAYKAGKTGGTMPCVLNAANEVANELFRKGKIEFLDIEKLVEEAMNEHTVILHPTVEQLLETDQTVRKNVYEKVNV